MKAHILILLVIAANTACAREWSKLKHYKAATGIDTLAPGHWLKKDRKNNTVRWTKANEHNISMINGCRNYVTFAQKRDFYKWYDRAIHDKGHDVRWAGVAYIVTKRLSYLDSRLVQNLIVRDKKLIAFARKCNGLILENMRGELQSLYFSTNTLTGVEARTWDSTITYWEQCTLLDTVYAKQPPRVLQKLNRMAGGKGIYRVVMPAQLRIKDDIKECHNRVYYGLNTIAAYYDEHYGKKR